MVRRGPVLCKSQLIGARYGRFRPRSARPLRRDSLTDGDGASANRTTNGLSPIQAAVGAQ